MSTEIITNKANPDALSKSVAVSVPARSQSRQTMSQANGNDLPLQKASQVSAEELQNVVKRLNEHVQLINRNLQFSVDEQSGRSVIRVVNAETQELVRQIPSEEALRIAHNIQEQTAKAAGLIFQTSA